MEPLFCDAEIIKTKYLTWFSNRRHLHFLNRSTYKLGPTLFSFGALLRTKAFIAQRQLLVRKHRVRRKPIFRIATFAAVFEYVPENPQTHWTVQRKSSRIWFLVSGQLKGGWVNLTSTSKLSFYENLSEQATRKRVFFFCNNFIQNNAGRLQPWKNVTRSFPKQGCPFRFSVAPTRLFFRNLRGCSLPWKEINLRETKVDPKKKGLIELVFYHYWLVVDFSFVTD